MLFFYRVSLIKRESRNIAFPCLNILKRLDCRPANYHFFGKFIRNIFYIPVFKGIPANRKGRAGAKIVYAGDRALFSDFVTVLKNQLQHHFSADNG